MKRVIKLILLIVMIIPVMVIAVISNHDEAISKANSYILKDNFGTRNKFLLLNNPINDNSSYRNGGLLTKKDYDMTVKNFDSWLIIPSKFWLETKTVSGNYYYSNGQELTTTVSADEEYETRVTEYVRPRTRVTGEGTISNPWEFINVNYATLSTNNKDIAYFFDGTETSNSNEKKTSKEVIISNKQAIFEINVKKGYENDPSDGCGLSYLSRTSYSTTDKIKYVVNGLTKDYSCVAKFRVNEYVITYDLQGGSLPSGKTNPSTYNIFSSEITLNNPTNNPNKKGFIFTGWTGTGLSAATSTVKIPTGSTGNRKYIANWRPTKAYVFFTAYNGTNPGVSIKNPNPVPEGRETPDQEPSVLAGKTIYYQIVAGEKSVKALPGKKFKNIIQRKYDNLDWYDCNNSVYYAETLYFHNAGIYDYNNDLGGIYLTRLGYIAPAHSEWKCASENCTNTYYDQGKSDYTSQDFCESDYQDCAVVLEPNWQKVDYSITYHLNNGNLASGVSNPTSYNVGTETFTLNNPSKNGYNFDGWTGSNGTTKQKTVSVTKGSTGNKTFDANYSTIPYTITYKGGGSLDSGKTNPTSYDIETSFTLNNPKRSGYAFTGWTGTGLSGLTTTVSVPTGQTGNREYTANWKDNQAPQAVMTTNNTLKSNKQTLTLSCTDNVGVTSYYFGTKSSPADSDYTAVTATTNYSGSKDVTSAGKYYFFCRDAVKNVSTSVSKEFYIYKVENRLQNATASGEKFQYTSTDYAKIGSTLTYIALKDTTLTLNQVYTIPSHSNANRFAGYSLNAAGTTAADVNSTAPKLTENNKVYTMWFNRNIIYVKYQVLSDESFKDNGKHATYNYYKESGYVTRKNKDGTKPNTSISSFRYGAPTIDLYNNGPSAYFHITKTGRNPVSGAEWVCASNCPSGATYPQNSKTISNTDTELCNTTNGDCTIELKVNWEWTNYSITYVPNNGKMPSSYRTSYTMNDDTFNLKNPTANDTTAYSFNGWFENSDFSGTAVRKIEKGTTGDKTFYAKYVVKDFTIDYDLKGGILTKDNPESYNIETTTFTLNNPKLTSYTFIGWTGSNGDTPNKNVSISKGSKGDKDYVANYCRNCANVSNGTCSLNYSTGKCVYTTTCESGYILTSGSGKYNPVCEKDETNPVYTFTYTTSSSKKCKSKTDCTNNFVCNGKCTIDINSELTKSTITVPNNKNWNIEFYVSGTLKTEETIRMDLHAVGGGGSGGSGGIHWRAGGGGGGYTSTQSYKKLNAGSYKITVGAGGAKGTKTETSGKDGGVSSIVLGETTYVTANGGHGGNACEPGVYDCDAGTTAKGGNGGSGGGASGVSWDETLLKIKGGQGGNNGGNGSAGKGTNWGISTSFSSGGSGQKKVTRDFGTGTKRAGGGGGRGGFQYAGGDYLTNGGTGGDGGGGAGAKYNTKAKAGTNNYGGGGGAGAGDHSANSDYGLGAAGGTGIVIIRNARFVKKDSGFTNQSGTAYTDRWVYYNNRFYYVNTNGIIVTGWKTIGDYKYYFAPKEVTIDSRKWPVGSAYAGLTTTISSKSYTFNARGICTAGCN